MRQALIIVVILAMAWACEPSGEFDTATLGQEYFPLKTGAYIIYDVDSTVVAQNVETRYLYQLRVEVKGSFTNGAGNTSYVIQRQKRADENSAWTEAGTWSAWTDARSAVSVEGNTSFVRLRFPIAVGSEWNGNELNSFGGDEDCGGSPCDRYSVAYTDPDVVVMQSNVADQLVKYDVRLEIYFKDIGLTYKELTVLEYCTSQDCFGKQFVDKGLKYKQTYTAHGQL